MVIGAIFLLILVFAFILLYVAQPFFERQGFHSVEKNQELSPLLAERERLLTALQELDSDQALEKIPAEDYPILRTELIQRGAEILRQIDALTTSAANERTVIEDIHPDISTSILATLSDDDLEELLAKRRALRKDKTAGFCPKCGKPVLFSDAFCPSCGHALK